MFRKVTLGLIAAASLTVAALRPPLPPMACMAAGTRLGHGLGFGRPLYRQRRPTAAISSASSTPATARACALVNVCADLTDRALPDKAPVASAVGLCNLCLDKIDGVREPAREVR